MIKRYKLITNQRQSIYTPQDAEELKTYTSSYGASFKSAIRNFTLTCLTPLVNIKAK
jgi:hypothetical protein